MIKILVILLCLILPPSAFAGVVFEDNFDSQADWQPRPSGITNDAAPSGGIVACDYGENCTTKLPPTNWTNYRTTGLWWGPTYQDTIRVKATAGDGTVAGRGGSGKSFIVYNESNAGSSGDGWGADGQITKLLDQDQQEIYIRVWMRTQANWNPGTYAITKMVRALHFDRTGSIYTYFSNGFSAPAFIWDFKYSNAYGTRYMATPVCDPQSTYFYCPSNAGLPPDNALISGNTTSAPTAAGMYADTNWHRIDLHLKMNTYTSDWNADGIYEFWYDGVLTDSYSNIKWKYDGSDPSIGWNTISIGGNASNQYADDSAHGEQWYAIDDVVVSTTAIPTDYVIGGTPTPINGTCGTSSGQSFSTTPSTNLCSAGTATAVTGQWTWGCEGANGGTSTSSCSATLAGQAVSAVFRGSKITGSFK